MKSIALDAAGHRRSPATMPSYHQGRSPRNKGSATRQTRQRSKRSSPSCAPPARSPTGSDYAP
jgi:hypothetical protein